MDARIATVEALLHGSSVFLIPHFQRSYSWERKQWERLWSDVVHISNDATSRKHFIGPLVCAATTPIAGNNLTRFEVIDGQQRLTTLSVLFGALRDAAYEIEEVELAEQITEDFLIHHRRKDAMRYKLIPRTADRLVWQRLIERQGDRTSDASGIDDAWAWFLEQCRSLAAHDGGAALRRIQSAAGQRLAFVSITIVDENPYRVFESLNTSGLALTEFDLVRNHLFMKVPVDAQETFDEQVWRPFERIWTDACGTASAGGRAATTFLRQFLMRKAGRFNKGETFLQFKIWSDALGVSPEAIIALLSSQAQVAVSMIALENLRDRRQRGSEDADWPGAVLEQRMLQLAYCDAGTAMPLVLELFDRHRQGELETEDLVGCLQDLVGFLVRRTIAGERTKHYDKRFVEITRNLGTPTRQRLQESLHRIGWPSNGAVLSALRNFPLYKSDTLKARLILEELERASRHKEKVQLAPLQIEHVLPQRLSGADAADWKKMLGDSWRADHERVVHTLGNLTLTGFNQKMSNKAFGVKRTTLKASKLNLNEHFHGLRRWTTEAIDARGQQLGEAFLTRFPVVGEPPPASEQEVQEKSRKADRNRAFWRKVADVIAETDGDSMAGNPSGKPYLDLPTSFRCLKIVPWFDRRQQTMGVMASFTGDEGDLRFATVRAHRSTLESQLGIDLGERGRLKHSAANFMCERPLPNIDSPEGERAAVDWLANQAVRLREVMEPVMQLAGARTARLKNTERHQIRKRWFLQLLERARARTPLHAHRTPGVESWVSAASGVRGLIYVYVVAQQSSRVEFYLMHDRDDPSKPKRRFDWLVERRKQIAKTLPDLVWERLDDKAACRLSIPIEGGYRFPESAWPTIHSQLIDAMVRLHATMQPFVDGGELERV